MSPFCFFHRVFFFVLFYLFFARINYVNLEVMTHDQDPAENVRQFFADMRFVGFYIFFNFFLAFPLEVLQNFRRFKRERDRQIFRIMELLPIPRIAKGDYFLS